MKLFQLSVFKSVDIWSSISCLVLDIELADMNVTEDLGVFTDGKVQGYLLRPPKKYNPTKEAMWCIKNSHEIV